VRRGERPERGVDPTGTRRRPITSDDFPPDIFDRDGAEDAAVNRGAAAVVAEHPHRPCRNAVVEVGAHRAISPWVGERTLVDADLPVFCRDPLTRESDDPLDEEPVGVRRVCEDRNLAPSWDTAATMGDDPVVRFECRPHRIVDDREPSRYPGDRCRDRGGADGRGNYTSCPNVPSSAGGECTEQNL